MRKLLLILAAFAVSFPTFAADNTVVLTPGSGVTMRTQDVGSGIQSPYNILGTITGTPIYGTAGTANAVVLTIQGIAAMTPVLTTLTGTNNIATVSTVTAVTSITNPVQANPGTAANWGIGATGSTVPANGIYNSINVAGNLRGVTGLALGATFSQTIAIVDGSGNQVTSFGGSGGTSSNFGSAFPSAGTAIGVSDGTNMIALRTGTAGTAAATSILTVQGIASMTPILATLSGTNTVTTVTTLTGGGVASGATDSGNPLKVGGKFNSTPITLTDGQRGDLQLDASGFLKVNVVSATGLAQGSTTASQTGSLIMGAVTTAAPSYTTAQTSPLSLNPSGALRIKETNPYPDTAVPYTATATGTTGATTATLAGAASVTTYLCGFSIRANATAAATGNATVTGVITATLNFTQWTAPNASGLGITEMIFQPCIPASTTNTSIAVVSAAPGTGGVVSVTAWGYKL